MVDLGDPFQRTLLWPVKLAPLTVRLNAAAPAVTDDGLNELIEGATGAAPIENGSPLDVPPSGSNTVTVAVPAETMSEALIAALTEVAPRKVVVRLDPFQRTALCAVKLDPLTVRLKAADPAVAEDGESELTTGGACCAFGTIRSHIPRPNSAARSVRDERCKASAMTKVRGRPDASGSQPVEVLRKTPMSVAR